MAQSVKLVILNFNQTALSPKPKKAVLSTKHDTGAAQPDPGTPVTTPLALPEGLPILLAGPIIRRTEAGDATAPGKVTFWAATSVGVTIDVSIFDLSVTPLSTTPVAFGSAPSFKLGERLFINLITVKKKGGFDLNKLFGYNFDVTLLPNPPGLVHDIVGDVLLDLPEITYGDLPLPAFFIPLPDGKEARFAHGSCRKLHGSGIDAMTFLDKHMALHAKDLGLRPPVLLLTGDQIYADDVLGGIIEDISNLGMILLGFEEQLPVKDVSTGKPTTPIVNFKQGQRGFVVNHGFTSTDSANHLLGIGDFFAMYILAWSPEIWRWDQFRSISSFQIFAPAHASPEIRRIFANIPTYMIFDDHEITDDWNLTFAWKDKTDKDPIAKRIIANGLGAYWAFQGIGNDPGKTDGPVKAALTTYLQGKGADPASFENTMLGFHDWRFIAPAELPVIFLDTRTERVLSPRVSGFAEPSAGLMNDRGRKILDDAIKVAPGELDKVPVIIVSPGPVIGYKSVESLQKKTSNLGDPTKNLDPGPDPEVWAFNPLNFAQFLHILVDSGRKRFVILSGDVHYGFTAVATCSQRRPLKTIEIVQLTSTALRNEVPGAGFIDSLKKAAFDGLLGNDEAIHTVSGHFIQGGKDYEFFENDPFLVGESQVVIPPIVHDWDLQIKWRYLTATVGSFSRKIIVPNNVGIVKINTNQVDHGLLFPVGEARAAIQWDDIVLPNDRTPVPGTPLP